MNRRTTLTGLAAALAAAAFPLPISAKVKHVIMPSLSCVEQCSEAIRENTRTIFWEVMERWSCRDGKLYSIETAKVVSPRYWQWLAEETEPRNHYPHIQFGGAVVAGKGDPEFYNRWLTYARTLSRNWPEIGDARSLAAANRLEDKFISRPDYESDVQWLLERQSGDAVFEGITPSDPHSDGELL